MPEVPFSKVALANGAVALNLLTKAFFLVGGFAPLANVLVAARLFIESSELKVGLESIARVLAIWFFELCWAELVPLLIGYFNVGTTGFSQSLVAKLLIRVYLHHFLGFLFLESSSGFGRH